MLKSRIGNSNLYPIDQSLYTNILDKIYTSINFQKIRYQIINNNSYLDIIKSNKHYITSHFQGYNFMLAFLKINNIKYNLLIMKNLKHLKEQNNIQDIKIYKFDTLVNNLEYYDNLGTIFDGKIINVSNKSSYIIHDAYLISGENLQNLSLPEKLQKIDQVINNIKIENVHNFDCKICRLYECKDLPDLIFNKIKTTDLRINGLMFLPEYTGKYYIYTNDTEFEDLKKNTNMNISLRKNNNCSEIEFYMKKTNVPDVYELYDSEENNLVKEGIAHIPNIKISHYIRNLFRDKNMIKINCIKSEKFNKWIPICDDYINYSEAIF